MSSSSRAAARHYWVAIRAMLVLTLVLGAAYPLLITAISQVALPWQANGSLIRSDQGTVGSALIGQSFTDANAEPAPEWFRSRPSAADYDAAASGGSNWGPENPDLIQAIEVRKDVITQLDNADPHDIPADALTASASGLDPHISPEYARLQVERVAEARMLDEKRVRDLVESRIQGRDLGYLGEPTVNVLQLNLALAEMED